MKRELKQMPDGSMCDPTTGEVFEVGRGEGTFVYIPFRQKLSEDWFMAFNSAFEDLAKDKELWGQPTAVLHYLMSKLSFENYIAIEQVEIARALEIEKTRVSEAIRKLLDKKIIERGPRLGKTWSYKLNHYYGWRGSVVNLQQARNLELKPKRKSKLTLVSGKEV